MKRAPSVFTVSALLAYLEKAPQARRPGQGKWPPARPVGMYSIKSRVTLAWEVFTGQADVLRWPDGD